MEKGLCSSAAICGPTAQSSRRGAPHSGAKRFGKPRKPETRYRLRGAPAGHNDVVSPAGSEEVVLATARALVQEVAPKAAARVGLDSVLDRDLGLDSLALVELISRLEDALGLALDEESLLEARTLRDLVAAIEAAPGNPPAGTRLAPFPLPSAGPERPPDKEAGGSSAEARTLTEVVDRHAEAHPDRVHIRLLTPGGAPEDLTYGALASASRAAAGQLLGKGLERAESVALMLPTGRDYFISFLGTLRAGGIPVPIYPPSRPSDLEEHLRRQASILRNAQARFLVSVPEAAAAARLLRLQVPGLSVVTASDLSGPGSEQPLPAVSEQDAALLQYTSGATSLPKGVVLTHANLIASIRAMGEAVGATANDVFVSWLPLYHDMGLIGAWLGSLVLDMPLVLMSPTAFLSRPARWLQAISQARGTISAAPNFAYELCLHRISDEELDGVDLSSWRLAFNGAEPVSAATLRRFSERFGPYGFAAGAMEPVYGLAEASLGVTFPPPGEAPVIDRIAREPFAASGEARPAREGEEVIEFVGCGSPLPGFEVRIVDESGQPVVDRREGRVEFRGPGTTLGYFRNPTATAALFDNGWLDSGDLGYLGDGELFVTGRGKDLVIRGGRNLHPQEIEEAANAVDGVRRGRAAAFGVRDATSGTERLVVVAETRERGQEEKERIRARVLAACTDLAGAPPDEVVLAPPGTVPKTSSGKVRRADCRRLYEEGRIGATTPPVWRQVTHLISGAGLLQLRHLPATAGRALYGAYALAIAALVAPPVWLAVRVAAPERRWEIFHKGGKTLLALCGLTPKVEGMDNLPPGACVLAANHASMLDGMLLAAIMPGPLVFPVAGELASNPVAAPFLRRLGAVFIDRKDRAKAATASQELLEATRRGAVLAFFPEGELARIPGLHPFRMGAFAVAEQAGVPLVPVAIRGTGRILRGDRRFPRYGRIVVRIAPPLTASQPGWAGAVELRDEARRVLLAESGEADLAV